MGLVTTIKEHFNVPVKMFIFNTRTNLQSTEDENSTVNLRNKTKKYFCIFFNATKTRENDDNKTLYWQ